MPPSGGPESILQQPVQEMQKEESEAELVFSLQRQSPINTKNQKKKHLFENEDMYNYSDELEEEKIHNRMNTYSFHHEEETLIENKRNKKKVKTREDELMEFLKKKYAKNEQEEL